MLLARGAERGYLTIIFLVFFGLLFIAVGISRLWEAQRVSAKAEPIFWGIVGVAIGFAFFGAARWFATS